MHVCLLVQTLRYRTLTGDLDLSLAFDRGWSGGFESVFSSIRNLPFMKSHSHYTREVRNYSIPSIYTQWKYIHFGFDKLLIQKVEQHKRKEDKNMREYVLL